MTPEEIIDFEALYDSHTRCLQGVTWKDSAAHYALNSVVETVKLAEQLADGSYRERPTHVVHITHPKPREAVGVAFRDRVYQRSLNDNAIYPDMTKSFIRHNWACQQAKGPDMARATLRDWLHWAYRRWGTNFYVLQADVKGYYDNLRHDTVERNFTEKLHPDVARQAIAVLRQQYKGEKGYNPGSQMVQIAGIGALDKLDHVLRERVRVAKSGRYMDDILAIDADMDKLQAAMEACSRELEKAGLWLHPTKSRIYPVREGIPFLGYVYRLTGSGKVLMQRDPKKIAENRRHLRRLVRKVRRGEAPRSSADDSLQSILACLKKGNNHKASCRLKAFYNGLWTEEIE